MSAATFRSRPAASGDDGFDISSSDDGQAFTLSFAEIQAEVGAGKLPDLVAVRVFLAVLPMDGGDDGVDISLATSGFALATEGANGYAVLSVNGQTNVEHFPAGTDQEFVQQLSFEADPPASVTSPSSLSCNATPTSLTRPPRSVPAPSTPRSSLAGSSRGLRHLESATSQRRS